MKPLKPKKEESYNDYLESRQKMSKARKGKYAGSKHPRFGAIVAKETKDKIRKTLDTNKPVKCVETGKIYPSSKEAWRQTGISHNRIRECANGKRKTAGKKETGIGYH